MGKQCLLPVLHPLGHKRLWFSPWRPGERLRANRYGIEEPLWERAGLVDVRGVDLVVVPLVAFDAACNRMGMGAGYYDRTFAWKLRHPDRLRPRLVGYAHDFQRIEKLDRNPWDVPLQAVITENGIACR